MAKKKIKIADKDMLGDSVDEEQKFEDAANKSEVTEPKGVLEEHFTLGSWKECPNYSCNYCQWSGVEKVRAQDHFIDKHMSRPKSVVVEAKIYDRFGNLITERGE